MNKSSHLRVHSTREKSDDQYDVVVTALLVLTIVAIGAIFFFMQSSEKTSDSFGDDPHVNLVGRKTPDGCTKDTEDPTIRASEEQKLGVVIRLVADEDWEHANALFETIFPAYLKTCEQYQYYQSALSISDNFKNFSAERETVETRLGVLSANCNHSNLGEK